MVLHGTHQEWTDQRSSCTHGYTTWGHLHEDNYENSTPETCGLDSSIYVQVEDPNLNIVWRVFREGIAFGLLFECELEGLSVEIV